MAIAEGDVVLWYDLDEGTGNTLDNKEGTASRDGTNSGCEWTTGGPTNLDDVLDFVFSNSDRVLLNNTLTELITSAANDFSISMWFKRDDSSGTQGLFGDWGSSPQRSIYLRHVSGTTLEFYISDGGTSSEIQLTQAYTSTSFVHIVVTRTGNDTELIINGSSVDTNTGSFTLPASTTDITLGTMDAQIAQVIFFNKAITVAEAQEIYNSGAGITYDGLFNPVAANTGAFFQLF